jgi:hypothetical protein
MGAKAIDVPRHLISDMRSSETDVTIGLEKDGLDLYLETVLTGDDIDPKLKDQFCKCLKLALNSKRRGKSKDNNNIQTILTSLNQKYTAFIFYYDVEKDNTLDIAYQFVKGNINIDYAHKIKKGKVVDGSVEYLSPEQTASFLEKYLDLKDKDYLKKAIEAEK